MTAKEVKLGGVYTPVLTPMSEDGEKVLAKNLGPALHFLASKGIEGILVLGSTGEASSLTMKERLSVLEEASATRGGMKMILGCISSSLAEVTELMHAAKKRNVDALLVPPPFYFKSLPAASIEKYFEQVLERAELPVLLYHIPSNTGFPIDRKMMERLSRFESLYGVKDSGGKIQDTAKFMTANPKKVLLGSDMNLLSGLKLKVDGVISACSNVVPELVVAIRNAWREGKDPTELQEKLSDIRKSLGKFPYLAALKRWMEIRGVPIGGVRLPNLNLNKDEVDKILLLASKFRP